MASKIGKNCKVALGANKVLGIGTWSMSGISTDQVEDTQFGDSWKSFQMGLKDGGSVSFNGFADPTDTTGQEALRNANLEATDLTTLRLYIDNTSYFEPCQTTGYFSPSNTTGASTQKSWVNVTSVNIDSDKAGLVNVSFEAKVSGVMVLV